MEKQKFRISIIDFLLHTGKHHVGLDADGNKVYYGDMVERNGEKNWFVGYRYGNIILKQVGSIAMISNDGFVRGDFSSVKKVMNTIGAGSDWLIIGFTDEELYERMKTEGVPFEVL